MRLRSVAIHQIHDTPQKEHNTREAGGGLSGLGISAVALKPKKKEKEKPQRPAAPEIQERMSNAYLTFAYMRLGKQKVFFENRNVVRCFHTPHGPEANHH